MRNRQMLITLLLILSSFSLNANSAEYPKVGINLSDCVGISAEKGVMRRDPSDVIKVGDQYYVWYTKGSEAGGYNGTVWYATSVDGHAWTEKGEALARGEKGSWEGQSVFTPNILVAEGRYWLFYTGVSFYPGKGKGPDSKIGIAVSDSPDGPWEKLASNPALTNSDAAAQFDSHLVDDACLIVRNGKYWFYYKGRQLGKSPAETQMGLAIADKPEGPYIRHEGNPVIPGNHEVLIWPQGSGVVALIGTTGPMEIKRSLMYSEDGMSFVKTHDVLNSAFAPGGYRPEAFTGSDIGTRIQWGVHIGKKQGHLPFIQRFDLEVTVKAGLLQNSNSVSTGEKLASKDELYTGKEYSTAFSMPKDNPGLPNALLIGDSISIGYTVDVRKVLAGKADVFRISTNGKHSSYGNENLSKWLGNRKWDVIHFNWGLWDVCYRNPKAKTQGHRDKVKGTLTTTPVQYGDNMEQIVARLKKTEAKLIWCATTPVPEFEAGRKVGDSLKYNAIVETIMNKNGIQINDLHAHALLKLPSISKQKGDVHFTPEGSAYLAEKVALEIAKALSLELNPTTH